MHNNYSLGIILKVFSLVLFTGYSLILMMMPTDCPATQLAFLRAIIASLILAPILIAKKIDLRITKKSFLMYSLRAIFNCGGMITWIIALKSIGANEATAIAYSTPLFVTILSIIFCNEKFNAQCFLSIVLSMVGMCIIIQPSFGDNLIGISIAFLSAFIWACYDIVCKKQTMTEHYFTQVFYNFVFSSLLLLPFMIYQWAPVSNLATVLVSSFVVALMSSLTIISLFFAYKFAPLVLLMPFQYTRLLFMAIATYFLFDQIPRSTIVIGIVIVAISTSLLFYQQYRGKI